MGGQQFGSETTLVDMGSMNRVLGFDAARGLIDVEAGIQWPELMRHLVDAQQGAAQQWGIRQKQTGADRSEEHTSELQSPCNLVCRLLLEKKKKKKKRTQRQDNVYRTITEMR